MNTKHLKRKYEEACNEYLQIFCEKQGMDNEGWVGDFVGGIAICSDFYFNISDIIIDIDTDQPKGSIINWYFDNLEHPEKHINYYSYSKGLRVSDLS